MKDTRHEYYYCLSHEDATPIPLDSTFQECPDYISAVLRRLDSEINTKKITFYITWDLHRIPSTGKDVVAIVLGDEWSRIPHYSHNILCTFKWYGTYEKIINPIWRFDSYLGILSNLKSFFKSVKRIKYDINNKKVGDMRRELWKGGPRVFPIPLGYGNQIDLPSIPMTERDNDIFFAGSISNKEEYSYYSPKKWIGKPKSISRTKMVKQTNKLKYLHPSINTKIHTNSQFVLNAIEYDQVRSDEVLDAREYSEALMNTKICLVPRGTSPETFRFFEGLRQGCVLITEQLPDRWFYNEAPIIQINSWRELHSIVPSLLDDQERLEYLHEASLQWWNEVCSEEAVAKYISKRISRLI